MRKPSHRPMDVQPEQIFGVCQSIPTAPPDKDNSRIPPKSTSRKPDMNSATAELSRQKSMKSQRAALAKRKMPTVGKQS